ncbi:Conserved oligomeric Golgi complex subunit 8 [Stylophora pistillata]|uniref:Conserved oligomeric Golgi complex subunit 8 n=2 Tax=Stylophora pistillata TaxID=50429 RepID=A0A2B4S6P6_STYPI|nr:Conserved oligomeric Golgi complex subunit 8 [Stylophora pistillata]
MKVAQEINTSRHLNSLTLARHTQLLEILEISQLMDSCVRNGYYEEALELSSYVQRLEKKLSNIPIIQNIVDVVQSSTQLMLSQLLQQLRSAIQLPACLRVIGYLRRLDLFSESELRIKFLQARDTWLQSVLASISSDDPYYHITKTIETSRVHLFDIVTQYRAIFSDDDPILSMENEDSPIYGNLFHCWILQKVQQFLKTLENDLKGGVGNRLDSLLGQCMYFGLSFSRVGADFRGLLPPLFHAAALKSFNTEVLNATNRFNKAMKSYSPQPVPSTVTSTTMSTMTTKPDELNPPIELLQHPPLAAFINSILSAFNNLRHCAPISLASPVTDSVCSALKTIIQSTCAFHRAEAAALNETERSSFANFCQVLGKKVIPYMEECLEAFFPSSVLTNLCGGSFLATDMRLDVDTLLVLLEPVMPQDSTQEKEKPPCHDNEAKTREDDRIKDQEDSESKEGSPLNEEPNEKVNEKLPDSEQRTQDLTQVEAVLR